MRPILLILVLVAAGCGSAAPAPRQPTEPDLDLAAPPPAPTGGHAPAAAEPLPWASPGARAADRPAGYHGRPIDLDFKEVDLADVFRMLADVGDVNIVVADDVVGKVTLRLRRVPWDQALVTVVKVKRLELERDGRVYLVRKPD